MKRKFRELPEPLNAQESFLYGINQRLEAILDAIEKDQPVEKSLGFKVPESEVKVEEKEIAKPAVKRTRKAPAKKEVE